jgi:hypothetical protein
MVMVYFDVTVKRMKELNAMLILIPLQTYKHTCPIVNFIYDSCPMLL